MELLILDDPILHDSHVLIALLNIDCLLFLYSKLTTLALNILILDLYHIFLVLVDHTQQLPLDLYEVLRGITLAEVKHFLLEDEVYIRQRMYLRGYPSAPHSFSSWWSSNDF